MYIYFNIFLYILIYIIFNAFIINIIVNAYKCIGSFHACIHWVEIIMCYAQLTQPLEEYDDDEEDDEGTHSSYTGMTAALVEAMQERRKQITGEYDPILW